VLEVAATLEAPKTSLASYWSLNIMYKDNSKGKRNNVFVYKEECLNSQLFETIANGQLW